ncbi:hypothetical protein OG552_30725 [Streptomyces sp. NBC_01476]|uniref:hypothetical protein n=1 Tax=Streptomyces sp. NBC_01476 TaxID=2903881 RepID=UPI002E32DC10|nr:hypothetical protein [Streptomyces sp. NBC_01476]
MTAGVPSVPLGQRGTHLGQRTVAATRTVLAAGAGPVRVIATGAPTLTAARTVPEPHDVVQARERGLSVEPLRKPGDLDTAMDAAAFLAEPGEPGPPPATAAAPRANGQRGYV